MPTAVNLRNNSGGHTAKYWPLVFLAYYSQLAADAIICSRDGNPSSTISTSQNLSLRGVKCSSQDVQYPFGKVRRVLPSSFERSVSDNITLLGTISSRPTFRNAPTNAIGVHDTFQ